MTRWLLWLLSGVLLGGIVHFATILLLPATATQNAYARIAAIAPVNRVVPLPSPTAEKSIVPLMDPAFAAAARDGSQQERGLGHALGRYMDRLGCPHPDASLVLAAYRAGIPCTVHVALGTDIVHMHPQVSGAALGEASMLDFRILCSVVSQLGGGVWMNLGSAVVLPEVFVKALNLARNLGHRVRGFTTIDMDFIRHYRPGVNVVGRPTAGGGLGIHLTGHHEIMFPLLWAVAENELARRRR